MIDGRRWVLDLPDSVATQRELLFNLLAEAEQDPRWRFVELSCSLARGNADDLSDVDVALGAAEEDWQLTLAAADAVVQRLGPIIDVLSHGLGWPTSHQRLFVQYSNGCQLDLVVFPAHLRKGLPPNAIALLDRDGNLATPFEPPILSASAAVQGEWAFLGWIALANVCKYCQRRSLWEALNAIDQARESVWRLWAASHRLAYPTFGLTTVLDAPEIGKPPGIETTVAQLELASIIEAAERLADLLAAVAGDVNPKEMSAYTLVQLRALAKE